MDEQSNDVLIVQQHEEDGTRHIYSWTFQQEPIENSRLLQDDLPDDDLSDLEDDTPQPLIDGTNTVDCFANLDDCTDESDFPRFQPLDEDDEFVSEAAILDE